MKTRFLWVCLMMPNLIFLLISCKTSTQPTSIDENTATSSPVVMPSTTPIPTRTSTPPYHTRTPIPTLSSEDAQKLLSDLLENNAGCRLPCFWGIIPGDSTWDEVKSFLETFTLIIGSRDTTNELRYSYFQIPFPKDMGTISHLYVFNNGVVDEIHAYNGTLAPAFYLPNFLKTYGQPEGIWIRTFREEERNSRPFLVDLFYPKQGILMEYSGGKIVDSGDRLQNCLEGMNSPFIYLWSPDRPMTFDEAKKRFLDTENFPQPVPLQEATGMDVNSFYEGFVLGTVCIETPKELWP